ncbi:response regulator transcription factor [Shimia litoralis]|uniref:Response regulator transcription factor n=1 Tax=Shimia litoralis TaxID=420403 RepID=A0A4U7N4U4_9RHOB|nr:response regulator transcription factor [Shimia litoralis]TKZ20577.1 response regulator transcription factor [Shimia litoralis]
MRLLIADDHDLVRETIGAFLEQEKGVQVTHASSLSEAMSTVRKAPAFDLVLLDYSMPGMDGLAGLQTMLNENGGNPVALISGTASKSIAEEALRMGASGFLPKTLAAKTLTNAVKFMAMGETFAPIDFMTAAPEDTQPGLLTPRESQVLKGISEGKSNKEIARDIDLREVTVKLHIKTLSRKLGAKNRTHAAMIARDQKLL